MSNPVVTVKQGKLKGCVLTLVDGSTCYSFKGIPYAQPPVGQLRFKAPLPPLPWKGIYDATEHRTVCPQTSNIFIRTEKSDEDCLFLNVYTKTLKASKLPVMVYIYGGAFMTGSGNMDIYGPDYLLQHDVILVTMNYRLELLGFLCLDTPEVPGNAGLKDQVAALRWVKDNIEKFGGDANNITIFGESAGSVSVTQHVLSPMSKGLFNKAIGQSGTCLDEWGIQRDAKERAFRAGKVLGKETRDPDELLKFLQSVPVGKLIALTFKTRTADELHANAHTFFVPVVEKKFEGIESFLDKEPLDVILGNKTNKVPVMLGYNSSEGLTSLAAQLRKVDFKNKHVEYLVPKEIASKETENKVKELGEKIKRFYVGDGHFSEENAQAIVNILTDSYFAYNINRFAYFYAAFNNPMYTYRFNFDTELNVGKIVQEVTSYKGANHVDEVYYLFCNDANKNVYKKHDKIKDIVYMVTKLWTNFAKTSNPTPDDSLGIKWQPYTIDSRNFFNIEDPFSNGQCADWDRVVFWNRLYCEAGAPHLPKSSL